MPIQYTEIFFSAVKIESLEIFDIFNIFAQNIDCGYTLEPPRRGGSNEYPAQNIDCGYTLESPRRGGSNDEAVLTSTHNLCFGAKIRKIGLPLHTPVLLNKRGV